MTKKLIGLNGPPGCGKGYVMGLLMELIPDATCIYINDYLFQVHRERNQGAAKYSTYVEYKNSPEFDRDALKESADWGRMTYGNEVFVTACEASPEYRAARVVIFDNIGYHADHMWAMGQGDPYLLLRIDTPFFMREPRKSDVRRMTTTWAGDSRRPFTHHTMLTAYDSEQMKMLIRYLHFAGGNGAIPESSPYHEYAKLWREHFVSK